MSRSKQTEASALRALLRDGTLAGTWTLDAARSEVRLHTKHAWGLLSVKGVFHQIQGTGTVSATGDVTGILRVAADSIDTKNSLRDQRVRSAEFFEVTAYPDITFAVQGASVADDNQARITGSLTVHGTTRPLSFDAKVSTSATEVQLDSEVTINRADFGMTLNKLNMVSWYSTIVIHAVFIRQ